MSRDDNDLASTVQRLRTRTDIIESSSDIGKRKENEDNTQKYSEVAQS